jgi:hypothetical protein
MRTMIVAGLAAVSILATGRTAGAQSLAGDTETGFMYSWDALANPEFPGPTTFLGTYLFANNSIVDDNCFYHLDMQTDGNLVTYPGPGQSNALWASGTNVRCSSGGLFGLLAGGCVTGNSNYAVMQPDGNFVIYNHIDGTAWWATNTAGHASDEIDQQMDGNLCVYGPGSPSALWCSGHHQGPPYPDVPPSQCTMQSWDWLVFKNAQLSSGTQFMSVNANNVAGCGEACNGQPYCSGFDFNPNTGLCQEFFSAFITSFPGSSGDAENAPVGAGNDMVGLLQIRTPGQ